MKIKKLKWSDPTTHPAGTTGNVRDFGGKTWYAQTPWDRDYSIDSFEKPEGTIFRVSFSWENIEGDPSTLDEAKALAQSDHNKRVMEMME